MQIRKLTEKDVTLLENLKSKVWPMADSEHYGENQPKFFKETFTLLAEENNVILGYITVIVDTGVAQIEPLMVSYDSQGRGIGALLLKEGEEKAHSLGAHKIWLETGADWKARKFYEKHGYKVRAILPHHTGDREFVLMDKILEK